MSTYSLHPTPALRPHCYSGERRRIRSANPLLVAGLTLPAIYGATLLIGESPSGETVVLAAALIVLSVNGVALALARAWRPLSGRAQIWRQAHPGTAARAAGATDGPAAEHDSDAK